jgi:hypothetical protein
MNKPETIITGAPDIDHTFSLLGDYIKFCVEQKRMLNSEANMFIAVLSVLPAYSLALEEKDRPELMEELKKTWKQLQSFMAQVIIELNQTGAKSDGIIKH